jgi:hypothetical protein
MVGLNSCSRCFFLLCFFIVVCTSHDEAFVEFFVQTGRVRYRGFHTFRLSLYCFLIQVLFTITSKSPPILRPFVILINLISIYWVYRDTQSVIDKAGDILFNFAKPKQHHDSENDQGHLSLKRTLSDMSIKNSSHHRANTTLTTAATSIETSSAETVPVEKPVPPAQNTAVGGGSGFLAGMRQRALDKTSKNDISSAANDKKEDGIKINARHSRKKGVARSKSGVEVYDVGPVAPPRRGGRRSSRNHS